MPDQKHPQSMFFPEPNISECNTGPVETSSLRFSLSCLLDIDECRRGVCEGKCVNTVGSFYCQCEKGYRLQGGVCVGKTHIYQTWLVNECNETQLV